MKQDPLNTPAQRQRLERLTKELSGWGVLIYMERPGDVAFLAPIIPELRGYEIVSASPASGGRDYDLWKTGKLLKPDLTLKQVERFLKKFTKSDDELKANVETWVKETFRYYGITPRPTHSGTESNN